MQISYFNPTKDKTVLNCVSKMPRSIVFNSVSSGE